jgi:hypothetical protein
MTALTLRRHWTLPRMLVASVAVVTMLGALLADAVIQDSAAQHIFNPAWPPHAKFHDAQYIVMSILLGALGLVLVAWRRGDTRMRLRVAASLLSIPWLGMFGALLFPGTAAYDPEFAARSVFVLGLPVQLFLAVVLVTALIAAVLGDRPLAAEQRETLATDLLNRS